MAGKKGGKGRGKDGGVTIVLKREEEAGHGHHGGAWKVAYADFVTAMMAFFLLMWLLNATSEEQRRGLADYFSPTNLLGRSLSGSGAPFGGLTPNVEGNMVSTQGAVQIETGPKPVVLDIEEDDSETPIDRSPENPPQGVPYPNLDGGRHANPHADGGEFPNPNAIGQDDLRGGGRPDQDRGAQGRSEGAGGAQGLSDEELRQEMANRDRQALQSVAEQIRQSVASDPALADLGRQLMIEQTQEGLRIQLLDSEGRSMFASGGGAPSPQARALITRVAQVAGRVQNPLIVSGHTDATPFRSSERTNWELSTERAHATRRLMLEAGVADGRFLQVVGHADRELLVRDQPNSPANRRVSILLLRDRPEVNGAPRAAEASGGAAR